jgi:hypothetical protein
MLAPLIENPQKRIPDRDIMPTPQIGNPQKRIPDRDNP